MRSGVDPKDYLAQLPDDLQKQILNLVGDHFQRLNNPNFYLNIKRIRLVSKSYKQMLDNFLSTPEVAFHLITHLPPHRVMRFIKYYRQTSKFQRLEKEFETFKTAALEEKSQRLIDILCYAVATDNIYNVPWDLFTRLYTENAATALAEMDDISKGCITNVEAVRRFVFHTTQDKDFNAVQSALNSLAFDKAGDSYFVNFANANFVLEMHNFRDGPTLVFSTPEERIVGANFAGANLQFVHFRCFLISVNFEKAIMNTAKLSGKQIANCNFNHAILKGARFNDPTPEGVESRIIHCNFSHADLERTIISNGEVVETNFTNANLSQVNVTGVEFINCQFTHANGQGMIFFDAPALLFTMNPPTLIVHHNIERNSPEDYHFLLRASASNFRDVLAAWHAQKSRGPAESVLAAVMREDMYASDQDSLTILRSAIPVPAAPELTITLPPEPRAKRRHDEENSDDSKRQRLK